MIRSFLCCVLLCVAWAIPARASVIQGVVRLPAIKGTAPSFNAYPGRASAIPGGARMAHGSLDDAVVYVERIPAAAESTLAAAAASAPHPKLAQRNQCFAPHVVPIAVGTPIDFPNLDPIYHNVFSVSPARRFDLGKYPRGQSKTVIFNRTGLINVYCDIHSDMAAFVLVLPHHAFTQPDKNGAYALPELPAGRYVVKLWHPDFGDVAREVHLVGDATSLDLSY